ncbi:hypothetical protein [uncultured Clostridium sp.]|uniref:hypothetical protein n=1 Tax=uncultured Clostridium sp. TaxID=59620 RepID=UPI0028E92846|nr:hypothetical protein [uncultured Clostridium sp.]
MENIMLGRVGVGMNWYNKKLLIDNINNAEIKKKALELIKKGLQHMDINYSLDVKQNSKIVRNLIKKKEDLYDILRHKVRKGMSNKWTGSGKWHKEFNKITPLLLHQM